MGKKRQTDTSKRKSRFSAMFWLVIMFEFFERGSYYGMMSVLSIYFTDYLFFSKESVGIIKSVIQPILYFLPILAGAMAIVLVTGKPSLLRLPFWEEDISSQARLRNTPLFFSP